MNEKIRLYTYYSKLLYSLIKPYKFYIGIVLILLIANSILNFIGIGMLMPIMDLLIGQETDNIVVVYIKKIFEMMNINVRLRNVISVFFGLLVLNSFILLMETFVYSVLQKKLMFKISSKIFKNWMEVDYKYFHTTKKGDVLFTITGTSSSLGQIIQFVNSLLIDFLFIITYLIMLFMLSPKLTALSIMLVLIIVPVMRKILLYTYALSQKTTQASRYFNSFFIEIIDGIQLIKTYAREQYAFADFKIKFKDLINYNYKLTLNTGRINLIQQPVNVLILIIVILMSNLYFGLTFQSIAVFLYILYKFIPNAQGIINTFNSTLEQLPNVKIAVEALSRENKTFRIDGNVSKSIFSKMIRYENVSFSYIQGIRVLKNISVEIEKNKMTSVVGATGSGKSTMISLLLRFYDTNEGKILVDDIDIKNLKIKEWLEMVSFVPQDVFLFNKSIKENILMGKLDADEKEILEATETSNAYSFIKNLPEKFDTIIGERGVKLSGGQKQMIALARALIRKPQILILDEATSSLDNVSEKLIQDAINKLSKNITIIAIAHRLSTVVNSDKIIVLDNGKIVETGKHEELLKLNRYYFKYYDLHLRSMDS